MKVVVTGGTGFLGQHLVKRLDAEGYDVVFTGRQLKQNAEFSSKFQAIDLTDLEGLNKAIVDATYVFHCAALSTPWGNYKDFYRTNVLGTQNVIDACLAQGVKRLIHVSTPSIYATYDSRLDVKESDPLPKRAINAYAQTKLLAEQGVKKVSQDLEVISIRPRAIYGEGDTAIFPRIIRALKTGRMPIMGDGQNIVSVSYVSNVVDALLLCANAEDSCLGQSYNICNKETVLQWELIAKVAEHLNLTKPQRKIPFSVAYGLAAMLEDAAKVFTPNKEPLLTRYSAVLMAKSMTLSLVKAEAELGYKPRISSDEGIALFLESLEAL